MWCKLTEAQSIAVIAAIKKALASPDDTDKPIVVDASKPAATVTGSRNRGD
jgi:hypothetical protein